MQTPRTLVALATYNEIENLPRLTAEILRVLPAADLLVVDDNSPDGSGLWCDEFSAGEPRVHCLHRPGKLGLGSATLDAFRWALERDYDVVVTMDADWSHCPAYLPALVAATDHADVAIGSRYVAGGSIVGWPLQRRLMSRLVNGLSRTLLGLPICDASGAFRAYRVAALRRISLDEIRATGYAYLEEIVWNLARADARFVELPITFHERVAGRSKLNLREGAGKLATIARLRAVGRIPLKIDGRQKLAYPVVCGRRSDDIGVLAWAATIGPGKLSMSVTIYEIAERAGVSSSTVARILRGEDRKSYRRSAETAERVRKIAQEMGYRPNLRARAFSRGRTRGIGLLYTDDAWIFEGVNTVVVNSLVRTLQLHGHHLVFCPIDDGGDWQEIVLGGQIDGGVVFQPLPAGVAEAVRERQLPLVLLGDNSDPTLSQVVVDDFSGAFAATKYLLGLGHERVMLFVHESVKPHCSVQERLGGYRAALEEAGLKTLEYVRVHEGNAVQALARGAARPTAAICYSDLESTLLAHGLWQIGLTIPGDVSLIGFNDVFATRYMTPPLTTVGFDAANIGEIGAKLVLKDSGAPATDTLPSVDGAKSSDDDAQPTVVTIKPNLIVRGSTGPAKSSGAVATGRRKTTQQCKSTTIDGQAG